MNKLINILNSILDENIEDESYKVRDYIFDENIEALEKYIEFFENIPPKDLYNIFEELITLIFEYQKAPHLLDGDKMRKRKDIKFLVELKEEKIVEIEDEFNKCYKNTNSEKREKLIEIRKEDVKKEFNKEIDKLKGKKPITIIKEDLKIINDFQKQLMLFQEMTKRLYSAKSIKTDECIFLNIPKEVLDTYTKNETIILNNKKLIKDLENKEFKIISKYNYYELENPSKTPIKEYLKKIRIKYSLKNVSQIELDLINTLKKDI